MSVSDRDSVDPRFKTIGKLRKGSPKQNGQFGQDLDYFRFTSERPEIVTAFHKAYGEQSSRLEVLLPYEQMELNFSSWRELYGANGLCQCRCDGSHWVDWIYADRHYHGYKPCEKEFRDTQNRCPDCPLKPVGRLSVILTGLWEAGYIGLVTLETHSWNDIANLSAKLVQWEPLTGKPFTLWREKEKIGAPINGKRAAVVKSLVKIELTDSFLLDVMNKAKWQAIADVQITAALPEPAEPKHANGFVDAEFTESPVKFEPIPIPDDLKDADTLAKQAAELFPFEDEGKVITFFYTNCGGNEWRETPLIELWQECNNLFQSTLENHKAAEPEEVSA